MKIKPFIDRYNWKEKNIHQKKMTGNFEMIPLVCFIWKQYPANALKYNSKREKQIIV